LFSIKQCLLFTDVLMQIRARCPALFARFSARVKYDESRLNESQIGHVSYNSSQTKKKEQNSVHFQCHTILTNDHYPAPPTSSCERLHFVTPPRGSIVHGLKKTQHVSGPRPSPIHSLPDACITLTRFSNREIEGQSSSISYNFLAPPPPPIPPSFLPCNP
jgi:hypothetical protein